VKGKYLGSNRMKAQELKRKKKTEKRGNKSEGNFRLKMQLFVLVSIKFLFFLLFAILAKLFSEFFG